MHVWAGVLFVLFLGLFGAEFYGLFSSLDPILTNLIQGVIPRSLDGALSYFSILGNAEPMILMLAVISSVYLWKNRKIPWAMLFLGLLTVVELLGKTLLIHPSPPEQYFRTDLPFKIPNIHVVTNGSFPSGHVSRTVFLAIVGIFLFAKKRMYLVACILVFVAVMAVSRVYLGEHWTSDVIGGLLLGGSMGMMAIKFL